MKGKQEYKVQSLENHAQITRILIILDSEKKLNFQSFVDDRGMSTTTLYRTLKALKELELVDTKLDNSRYPPQNMISLTDKGKKVAKHLKEIEEILSEE
ncbi:MAG: helix-turn-helix transcriptional regulator [Thermoplasmatales archaeon]|nr:helix-turn-helix transcriptional regulator [Candidatus Thermoplasmatota archaeon]MCL6003341.1 helix-turn-helix transcriptional regulator [Candidatus Thermoplasmatota archaeon]MDA8055611.1 helix-turn-helix transcriptional regulator [Thermoplasmatales archaeon]